MPQTLGEIKNPAYPALAALLERHDFPEGTCWQRERYAPNATVITEGGYSSKVYLVLSGELRILGSVALANEYRVKPGIRDVGPGEMFGEFALLDKKPHAATVVAVSETELAAVDCQLLWDYMDANPAIGYQVLKELSASLVARMRKTNAQALNFLAWGLQAHGYQDHLNSDPA